MIGTGYAAVLPPFEGFDEVAYFSAIRETANTGMFPIYGRSFIDRTVEEYERRGPMPWATGEPPFDRPGRMTYRSFFTHGDANDYRKRYRSDPDTGDFKPGLNENWESQHPPLYYLAMAPIAKLLEHFSLVTQILVLRLSSYLLAWSGFAFGWSTIRRYEGKTIPDRVSNGYLLYPFFVPMFFGEFARIGSDSLCLFILGLVFQLSFRLLYREPRGPTTPFLLGVLFGLGLLTKAFFLPLLASFSCLLLLRIWRGRSDTKLIHLRLSAFFFATIPALLIGGGWYVRNLISYGVLTGSAESILVTKLGGLLPSLAHNFSVYALVRDLLGIFVSWSWGGSWSLVRISPYLHIPLLLIEGWLALTYVLLARNSALDKAAWLPVWMTAPLLAGLFYHVLLVIALAGSGTPGWYLNIVAPFIAFAMGLGIERISRSSLGRGALRASLTYAALFLAFVMWSQIALFSGCAIKSDAKLYQFSSRWFCLDRFSKVTDHLSVIGWPTIALIAFSGALLCCTLGWRHSLSTVESSKFPIVGSP